VTEYRKPGMVTMISSCTTSTSRCGGVLIEIGQPVNLSVSLLSRQEVSEGSPDPVEQEHWDKEK
jgi:hypothetical protein